MGTVVERGLRCGEVRAAAGPHRANRDIFGESKPGFGRCLAGVRSCCRSRHGYAGSI